MTPKTRKSADQRNNLIPDLYCVDLLWTIAETAHDTEASVQTTASFFHIFKKDRNSSVQVTGKKNIIQQNNIEPNIMIRAIN